MKDDAIAQLSDQVIALTATMRESYEETTITYLVEVSSTEII